MWHPLPAPPDLDMRCAAIQDVAAHGYLSVKSGQPLTLLAWHKSFALVAFDAEAAADDGAQLAETERRPDSGDLFGVPPGAPVQVGILPLACLTYSSLCVDDAAVGTALDASGGAEATDDLPALQLKVERVFKEWRASSRRLLSRQESDELYRCVNSMGQLMDWWRLSPPPSHSTPATPQLGMDSTVRDHIVQLIEASTQGHDGALAPRTQADELATESNSSILQLLQLHAETHARILRGAHVPACASESLALNIDSGLHGGPNLSNDLAVDVSYLVQHTARFAFAAKRTPPAEVSTLTSIGKLLAHADAPREQAPTGLTQVVVDVDVLRGMHAFGQPAALFVSVYD
ncbi:hypothetical protein EON66_09865, partial [archaeon]